MVVTYILNVKHLYLFLVIHVITSQAMIFHMHLMLTVFLVTLTHVITLKLDKMVLQEVVHRKRKTLTQDKPTIKLAYEYSSQNYLIWKGLFLYNKCMMMLFFYLTLVQVCSKSCNKVWVIKNETQSRNGH